MKLFKILAVILVLSLTLGMAIPAFAQAPPKNGRDGIRPVVPFEKGKAGIKTQMLKPETAKFKTIKGEVTEVGADYIKVGDTQLFVAPDTAFKVPTLGKSAALADIKVGMTVIVLGYEKDGKLYIRYINVIPGKPEFKHNVGKVVEYSYDPATGGKIVIETKGGENVTFTILAGKFKILPEGAMVEVGSMVTVISNREPSTANQLIADGVVVHGVKPVPPPAHEKVSGVITEIDEVAKTIKIGETVVKYTEKTLFALRGQLAHDVDQEAVVLCLKNADGSLTALAVLVGVDLPQVMSDLNTQFGKALKIKGGGSDTEEESD